ncbi:MAG: hypothetical protein KR126chlam4_00394 [Candidatus Anoxychlamydiales bacterium]|nr:hypothetical protein [Candidatus Anoxychlamydiales bacterium]NGX40572.1 hypothetical protein [Candidatus Anoxychlamydiales bacterium]HEU64194.1 L,D-transpeptidase [Chlamydiota bacterium]
MSTSKIVTIGAVALFGAIAALGFFKKNQKKTDVVFDTKNSKVQEIVIEEKIKPVIEEKKVEKTKVVKQESKKQIKKAVAKEVKDADENLPDANLIDRLFATDSSRLPIVDTVTYTSRAPWMQGRPAWIADYASHYSTTRHFIARSLNKKADYLTQKIAQGDRFNVLRDDKNIKFHLVIDINRSKLWFYYFDVDTNERVLLKTYKVGLGRKESKRESGSLTPKGKYTLGSKVAIYKPNTMGYFQDNKIEMIKIFGTRWIPFDQEVENCTESAKGLGIHGAPWVETATGEFVEDRSKIGKLDSDGCIRLFAEDIEEIFSIVISRDTTIDLVEDFHDAKLPGVEKIIK